MVAETDLKITGAQAQFGRGVIEDVGKRVLQEFASRLERRLAGGEDEQPDEPPHPREEALDMGAAMSDTAVGRAARVAAPLAAGLVLLLALRRLRR